MEDPTPHQGTGLLIERSIVLALFAGLILGVVYVLLPFATGIMFGTIMAIAAWPLRQMLVARGWQRGWVAGVLVVGSICVVLLPVLAIAPALSDQITDSVTRLRELLASAPAAPPGWVGDIPFVGPRIAQYWADIMAGDGHLTALIAPYRQTISTTLLSVASGLAGSIVQLLIALTVAGMFWVNGEEIVAAVTDAADRLGGPVAAGAIALAGGAVRGVAYGVVGTAALQGVLMAIGLAIAGIPGAAALGFLTMLFSVSQILGPLNVAIWGGAAWWLYDQGSLGWAIFMALWGAVFVSTADNIVRPMLISRGMDMPLSLVLVGVFGGFVAFGFLGLFIGPTLLAVAFSLLQAWRRARPSKLTEPNT
ncbi:AI-2E family transporter [Humitalea sp. 24SJ18S-53]|uniref:AI-2E family transporter n=1 Tax=Humitalea sp. 24SJ18S-53 TaxID=3422307 RepID=UPI003D670F93